MTLKRSIAARACSRVVDSVSGWIARNAASPMGRLARGELERAHLRAENVGNMDSRVNGEFSLLERLAGRFPVRTVFDVGANVGDWTVAAAAAFPEARIHAFEPSPATFEQLMQRLRSEKLEPPRIQALAFALAESARSRTLYEYEGPGIASFADWHGDALRASTVEAVAGGAYAAGVGVEAIDFVKIDVEGFEMDVLRGFEDLIRTAKLGFVQFEYGMFAVERRIRLRDFRELLGAQYRLGRIMPAGVEFDGDEWKFENGHFVNYLAARADLVDYAN
jgi:FkbM family methyltransferase